MKRIAYLLLLLPLAVQATELPLATVNEEPVLVKDLEGQLARIHRSAEQTDRTSYDTERLMFKLINDVLIGQEARSAGMAEEPEIAEQITEYREELIYKYLEKVEITDRVEPDPGDVERLFHEQYDEMELRIITSYEEATANEILTELRKGADMDALARERSVDNIAVRGGLMKNAPRIRIPRGVGEVASRLQVGEIGGPVSTDLGWTVFRVESKTEAAPARLKELEGQLLSVLRNEKARALRAAVAAAAREHHKVVVDQELVDRMKPVRQPDARLIAEVTEPQRVVAQVGEHRTVRALDYGRALDKRWKGVRNEEAAIVATPIILNTLIERELLIAEGTRRGYGELPVVQALLRTRETELLVPRYLEEVVAASIEISAEEMKAYYDEHKDQFLRAPRVRLGQVTVPTMAEAEKVAEMLRSGADMAWVAQQHSTDGLKESGGLRGWMVPTPGLDALQDRLLEALTGEVLEPFGVEGNYIVLKMVAREEQGPFEFDQISGNVRQKIFTEKSRVVLDRYITTLRERSEIVLYEERIQALAISGTIVEPEAEAGAAGGHGH